MKLKSNQPKATAEQVVKDIRRATRRHYSTEDKIRIVLSGLRGEDSIAELCRKEGIAQGLYGRLHICRSGECGPLASDRPHSRLRNSQPQPAAIAAQSSIDLGDGSSIRSHLMEWLARAGGNSASYHTEDQCRYANHHGPTGCQTTHRCAWHRD